MKMPYGLLAVACLSLSLSSCADNQAESVPSSSVYQWSLPIGNLPLSSPSVESSGKESTAFGPSSESSAAPEPSSSSAVYCTVSIYQSYFIEEKRTYGNPRFDTSVTYEAGHVLFETREESHALLNRCRPVYSPSGGVYIESFFYFDKECTRHILGGFVIESDLMIFYYCYG